MLGLSPGFDLDVVGRQMNLEQSWKISRGTFCLRSLCKYFLSLS